MVALCFKQQLFLGNQLVSFYFCSRRIWYPEVFLVFWSALTLSLVTRNLFYEHLIASLIYMAWLLLIGIRHCIFKSYDTCIILNRILKMYECYINKYIYLGLIIIYLVYNYYWY